MSALKAFLRGVASVVDIGGALAPSLDDLRRPGETSAQADARALASDWQAVGDDLRAVTHKTETPRNP